MWKLRNDPMDAAWLNDLRTLLLLGFFLTLLLSVWLWNEPKK